VRVVLAGAAVAFAFCGLFVTAFHAPSPHSLAVGVVGRADASRLSSAGFDVRRYAGEAEARADLVDGELRGVLVADPPTVLLAGAGGPVPAQTARVALEHVAPTRPRVVDLVPLPAHDSRGLSAVFTALGAVAAGVAFGALLTFLARLAPLQFRLVALATFGTLAGLVVALTVDTLVGALTGAFWSVAGAAALGAAAVGAATHGLGRLAGPPGIALAVLLFVPLGQSVSGGALGPDLVPGFFGALYDGLPTGALLSLVREVVYFDAARTLGPLLVLCAWGGGGVLVLVSKEMS
jgi:hypothetical protein